MENQEDNGTGKGSEHSRRHSSRHSKRHSSGHSSEHSQRRHHRHSSGHHRGSEKPFLYPKRPRIEDRPKREKAKKIESLFTKNILTVFGMIFIAAAIWFGISNWNSFQGFMGSDQVKSTLADLLKITPDGPAHSLFSPFKPAVNPKVQPLSYLPVVVLWLAAILVLLAVSVRKKSMGLKLTSLIASLPLNNWLLAKLYITHDLYLLLTLISVSSLLFLLFFVVGFADPYPGRRKWKTGAEYFIILANSLLYYLTIKAAFFKMHLSNYESGFVFILSTFHLVALYIADRKNLKFHKIPYLLATLIITCLFLPLVFKQNQVILFLAPLSVFLVLFSRYSSKQTSVIYSLFTMLMMILVYFYQWIYQYFPDIADINQARNDNLFFKGLISSFFTVAALSINNNYLKKLAISFSNKWLKKIQYLKYLKALYLIVAYLSGYWVFNYFTVLILQDDRANMMAWFAYNCLYFIFFLHRLAAQRSSFFRLMVVMAIISTFAYFTFVHLNLMGLRKILLESKNLPPVIFYLHYVVTGLLIWLIFTLLHYFKRAFPGKKALIKSFWVYIYVISSFILLSEFDHLTSLLSDISGRSYAMVLQNNRRLPYSLLLILSSTVVIVAGFLIHSRFLRILSLFMLGIILLKILIYDRLFLSPQANIILFLVTGVVLLILSVTYPLIRRTFFQKDSPQSQKFFNSSKDF